MENRYCVGDVARVIEEFAPLGIQEKWDNSGLCIGSESTPASSILLGLDCTPELVDEAVACGADMIVTHHPLIFSGVKKISPDEPVGAAITKAVSAGISVYSAHTSADKVIAGVSGAMAEKLGLQDVSVLEMDGDGTGLGAVGTLPEPLSAAGLIDLVKERFSLKMLRSSAPLETPVRKVAVCGGAGSSLIEAALRSGAQAYVSADISYHHFFTREGFMIMDIGHYESEVAILDILFSLLKKNFPTFAVRITQNASGNPVRYY